MCIHIDPSQCIPASPEQITKEGTSKEPFFWYRRSNAQLFSYRLIGPFCSCNEGFSDSGLYFKGY